MMASREKIEDMYRSCMEATGDRDYCSRLVELIYELEWRRDFTYGDRPRLHLRLPDVAYDVFVAASREKKGAVIFLAHETHVAMLIYDRGADGRFVLRSAELVTVETEAMRDLPPSALPIFNTRQTTR
jgi:hypothetical protein